MEFYNIGVHAKFEMYIFTGHLSYDLLEKTSRWKRHSNGNNQVNKWRKDAIIVQQQQLLANKTKWGGGCAKTNVATDVTNHLVFHTKWGISDQSL